MGMQRTLVFRLLQGTQAIAVILPRRFWILKLIEAGDDVCSAEVEVLR